MKKNSNTEKIDKEEKEIELVPIPFKKGDVIKNYSLMCEALGEKKAGGNTKIAQLEAWRLFFDWRKEGHAFHITDILSPHFVRSQDIKKNAKLYYDDMQKILLSMLRNDEFLNNGQAHYVSKSALIKSVGLCNDNYFYFFGNRDVLAKGGNHDGDVINDFYTRTHNMFKRDIRNILNGLRNRALIEYGETYVITPVNEIGHETYSDVDMLETRERKQYRKEPAREATDLEINIISEAKFSLLKSMNLSDMKQVYIFNRQEEFYRILNEILFSEYKMTNVYKAYKIWFPISIALYLEEHHDKDYFKLSDATLVRKKLGMSRYVKETFNDTTENVAKERELKESEAPHDEKFIKSSRSLCYNLAGAREKYFVEKYKNEILDSHQEKLEKEEKKSQNSLKGKIDFEPIDMLGDLESIEDAVDELSSIEEE